MPPIKKREIPFAAVRRLLLAYELNTVSLGNVLGTSHVTASKRLQNPGDLTLSELARICRNAHIPAEEIREAIRF